MKFDLKPMDAVKNFTALCVALGLMYAAGLKTGWIIGEAEAEDIAQSKANIVAQQLYQITQDSEIERLNSDISILLLQINFMLSKPDRTEYDDMQLTIWKDAIGLKQKRLAEIAAEKAAAAKAAQ